MYKVLLCWKYLRTRFLAFVCIVSVMLGVATLVVVNSVMAGFSNKLKDRFHGLLSDVIVESPSYNGFPLETDDMMERIRNSSVAEYIEAMSPTIEVFGMLSYEVGPNREQVTIPVNIVGTDPKTRSLVGGFGKYFKQDERSANPSFDLTPEAMNRWSYFNPMLPPPRLPQNPDDPPAIAPPPAEPQSPVGAIPGFGITHYRHTNPKTGKVEDKPILLPGDTIKLMTVGAGKKNLEPVFSSFAVADSIRTEMTEYDSRYVYVPIDYLQRLRAMGNHVTHIQIRLKDYSKAPLVVAELRKLFPQEYFFQVNTWEDKQTSLLKAINIERGLLNLLLFMIVGVAGFCILAIFSMIVREKTRDIGILKSLGASDRGILQIFLGYGLLLGVFGAGFGTALGLLITIFINPIEHFLFAMTGVGFSPDVYYFDQIPTKIEPMTVLLVNVGAISIAVAFSVWPAIRAAWLKPVQALRYE
ncbi:ABC transporter permease [Zavarzinella formosa]|uniref:ABC transporter permease n=1 Tax=Zavarzinella formosa TaxID=360055 RepID=UPI0002F9327C|nr:FtsX-like permease family protein [Zavarzinella formosa]